MVFNRFRSLLVVLPLALSAFAQVATNNVYIISNAETPALDLPGLTTVGRYRAYECLPALLAPLDIGLVISCPYDPESRLCLSTNSTAAPIATSLGLTVNTTCGADEDSEDDCVGDLIKSFKLTSTQAILVVWDISAIEDLFENLDINDDFGDDEDEDDDEDEYEDEFDDDNRESHHDLIITVVGHHITSMASQNCPGTDQQAPGTFRRSLKKRSLMKQKKRQINSHRFMSRIAKRHY
ncbi:hypothetical protein BDZ94DRAFT_1241512 [Collybia nuda]|uniref:Uncharacterized protein n=1 Tax=Collybia nuda TaxID=64659 RepID=A0A9P6CCW3_9AGAR|nr:hypothetical protein BDZ94DRAFT_1241512 [Collybia nuda]